MNIDKIKNDPGVRLITEDLGYTNLPLLVGGAIIDIDRNKKPKDYDICNAIQHLDDLIQKGWKFICETKTAITLTKNSFTLQLLKTNWKNFEFKISQSRYNFKTKSLKYDKVSYNNKTLIPTTFENKKIAKECLFRIPHYQEKGYDIHPMTYLSLLNVALSSNNTKKTS